MSDSTKEWQKDAGASAMDEIPEDDAALEHKILRLTGELIRRRLGKRRPFKPGITSIPYAGRVYDEREVQAAVQASLDFWLTLGPEGQAFERELAEYLGVKRALMVNSGSSANLIALMSLTSEQLDRPLRKGDEVITVACGFPTTVNPIVQAGCIPVFVDVDMTTLGVDVTQLEAARSERTRAVLLAHTLGNPFDLDAVLSFCRAYDLVLIEDNCDALGSRYRGQLTGTFGNFGTSSFYPAHHITAGEGGAVYTHDLHLAKIAESFRDWGRDCWCACGRDNTCGKRFAWEWDDLPAGYDHKYVYRHLGYNLKPTDIQAAIGRVQLRKLGEFGAARRRNWARLRQLLSPLEGRVNFVQATPGADPSWFGLAMVLQQPDHEVLHRICAILDAKRVGHRRIFAGNLLRHPAYRHVEHRKVGLLPVSDHVLAGGFFVGVYPGLDDQMMETQAKTVIEAVEQAQRR
ncbi:MAG TPA: lipopolysaccharide biosynthesis protein RfbH [Polyangiaceae bacterium]|mgnify:FL=1|nr:MAG: UDP-4-amino-4-deoxy-L-arabinose--oxoglutarate aminotransferase [Deltaproteobacteria bacterium ADurb.Bin207]HNS98358.1 lipopolysaccharide biosynthesis protein RfbH [Polyangiaceae bacterium]HNZ25040.1 lipopolysaccharide biosynthesis protein RfbH [Polyangiaceae bacterium]HOD25654.1 lipopolysaccharide biosynthesis protein RfbH [Polyangiaceae bacterium]HOE51284.1 lipopolysaccharide biosynthesis protein RfbH [Polyangiaceae bacterium]